MALTAATGAERLLGNVRSYLPASDVAVVQRALDFAAEAHASQRRASGEPYVTHPIAAAQILADLRLDGPTIAAALLHDVIEDTASSLEDVESAFGSEIAVIVDGVTKLDRVQWFPEGQRPAPSREAEWAENVRKMFLAMAEDIRVVLVKLADRLHNMETLDALAPEKRLRIAQETMEIYAPLANRLGIWEVKSRLEDLSFKYLEPEAYAITASAVQQDRTERERYVRRVVAALREHLESQRLKADVFGRPKALYSTWNKMQQRGAEITQIYDLFAVRVIVETIPECYSALGAVHGFWHPLPGQFDDYISSPKESMYQSLHTTVVALDGKPVEIQIRTAEMNQVAEYGVAAHWRYKEGRRQDPKFDAKVAWLRQLMDWQKDVAGGAQAFVDSLRTDLFQDQLYVFTPKGEIKELPAGGTPLDFAYQVHTEIGHRCVGAKVNGRLVALNRPLQNGDIVEIVTSKASRGPSRDWLMPALGYVKSSHAREKIRQWFRRQERDEAIVRGRELVDRELRRLGVSDLSLEEVASALGFERSEDFFAAMGYGDINPQQMAAKLVAPAPTAEIEIKPLAPTAPAETGAIRVSGVGDLMTRLARCCSPVPGDRIVGFITRGRGITVHRIDCASVLNEDEPERLVPVEWGGTSKGVFPVTMRIAAFDREGLVRDIAAVVADENLSIQGMNVSVQRDQTAVLIASMDVPSLEKLSRVMARIQGVRDVLSVQREVAGQTTS
ncbi:MAG: bifunctional (p)ppGpp synthetase/guanosine-3',5'-bis(diphosphate) 3'-pyrophosphohydrolase [Chloroflexi bacterium]|nr:bifunctional (p)ppGpp synthetase/guanosine-3',5'-bis(diphosphate) 3'-pyrophosphohydrolase [Chloroflexota bacterium]